MVGTFYRASSPGGKPFVEVGNQVKEGETICIIEAMKILNEIEADKSGTITRILGDRKSTRLNSSHSQISYAVFCLKKKKKSNWTRYSKPRVYMRPGWNVSGLCILWRSMGECRLLASRRSTVRSCTAY